MGEGQRKGGFVKNFVARLNANDTKRPASTSSDTQRLSITSNDTKRPSSSSGGYPSVRKENIGRTSSVASVQLETPKLSFRSREVGDQALPTVIKGTRGADGASMPVRPTTTQQGLDGDFNLMGEKSSITGIDCRLSSAPTTQGRGAVSVQDARAFWEAKARSPKSQPRSKTESEIAAKRIILAKNTRMAANTSPEVRRALKEIDRKDEDEAGNEDEDEDEDKDEDEDDDEDEDIEDDSDSDACGGYSFGNASSGDDNDDDDKDSDANDSDKEQPSGPEDSEPQLTVVRKESDDEVFSEPQSIDETSSSSTLLATTTSESQPSLPGIWPKLTSGSEFAAPPIRRRRNIEGEMEEEEVDTRTRFIGFSDTVTVFEDDLAGAQHHYLFLFNW